MRMRLEAKMVVEFRVLARRAEPRLDEGLRVSEIDLDRLRRGRWLMWSVGPLAGVFRSFCNASMMLSFTRIGVDGRVLGLE